MDMATPSVTYTGTEVALLAGIIAGALPALDDADFDVADLLLDKAMAALPRPMSPALAAHIERLRASPAERFWARLTANVPPGAAFDIIAAGVATGVTASRALLLLEELRVKKDRLLRVGRDHWTIRP
jgi:hypothetical protein